MKELIPVKDNKVSAKSLYEFLELSQGQFSRWAKSNILDNIFAVNGTDYRGFDINVEGNLVKDYSLSIDFAKKLCMVSKSKRGEEARNYFIEIEKRYKNTKYQLGSNQNDESLKTMRARAMMHNAKARTAKLWMMLAEKVDIPEYKQIANAYAANTLAGRQIFELPRAEQQTYSATDIGGMLGVTAMKIGILSNRHNLKTEQYGKLFYDKSRHSSKEVETFRYYESVIPVLKELLIKEGAVL